MHVSKDSCWILDDDEDEEEEDEEEEDDEEENDICNNQESFYFASPIATYFTLLALRMDSLSQCAFWFSLDCTPVW
jgi:hypothetical protein